VLDWSKLDEAGQGQGRNLWKGREEELLAEVGESRNFELNYESEGFTTAVTAAEHWSP